jgi:hypothetical protein
MYSMRGMLDLLPHDALVRLCSLRKLPARSDEARRERLARSYRGDTKTLLNELRHPDLLCLINKDFVADNGKTYRLKNAARHDVDSLRSIGVSVFVENRLTSSFEAVAQEKTAPAKEKSESTRNIPQADNLSRIAQLVELLASKVNSYEKLAKKLSISQRQVLYYTQAASFLGLIKHEDDFYSNTNEGTKLAQAKSEDKLNFIINLFLKTSFVKSSLVPIASKSEVGAKELTQAIKKTGYSAETATRRAQTLLSWFRQASAEPTQSIQKGKVIQIEEES